MTFRASEQGILLDVQAQPGAKREGVVGLHAGRVKVSVHQIAEKGKANREVIRVLAEWLEVKKSQLSLVSGETSSQKVVLITAMTVGELKSKVEELLTGRTGSSEGNGA